MTGNYRYTRVYVRNAQGDWKIVSFEASRVREPGPHKRTELHYSGQFLQPISNQNQSTKGLPNPRVPVPGLSENRDCVLPPLKTDAISGYTQVNIGLNKSYIAGFGRSIPHER